MVWLEMCRGRRGVATQKSKLVTMGEKRVQQEPPFYILSIGRIMNHNFIIGFELRKKSQGANRKQ